MNRRSLLRLLPVAIAGAALGSGRVTDVSAIDVSEGNVIGGFSYHPRDREALRKVTRQIIKDSAHRWSLDSRYREYDEGAVLITLYGNLARKLIFNSGYIIEREITLNEQQCAALRQYQESLNLHIPQRIGSELANGGWRLRAWIYNGRRPNEWVMSVGKI